MPKMWSNTSSTHDASASAEVVVGPKICLYGRRDGPDVAGHVPAALLPALPKVFTRENADMGGIGMRWLYVVRGSALPDLKFLRGE